MIALLDISINHIVETAYIQTVVATTYHNNK